MNGDYDFNECFSAKKIPEGFSVHRNDSSSAEKNSVEVMKNGS